MDLSGIYHSAFGSVDECPSLRRHRFSNYIWSTAGCTMLKESSGSGEVVVFSVKRYRRNIDTISIPFIGFDFTSKPSVNQSSHMVSWHQYDYYYRRVYSKFKKNGTGHILRTHRAFCKVTPRQVFAVWMLIVALQWLPRLVWSIRPRLLCTRPSKHHPRKTRAPKQHNWKGVS